MSAPAKREDNLPITHSNGISSSPTTATEIWSRWYHEMHWMVRKSSRIVQIRALSWKWTANSEINNIESNSGILAHEAAFISFKISTKIFKMFISSVGDEHFVCCASSNFHQKLMYCINFKFNDCYHNYYDTPLASYKRQNLKIHSKFWWAILRAAMFLSGLSVGPFTVVLLHKSTKVLQISIVSRQESFFCVVPLNLYGLNL